MKNKHAKDDADKEGRKRISTVMQCVCMKPLPLSFDHISTKKYNSTPDYESGVRERKKDRRKREDIEKE